MTDVLSGAALLPPGRLARGVMRLSVTTLLMVMAFGACGDDVWVPEVGSVEVIPHDVYVLSGESVLLKARIRDPDGDIINIGGFEVDPWEATNDLVQFEPNPSGLGVVITATTTSNSVAYSVVTATVEGEVSNPAATITILPGSNQADSDILDVEHSSGQAPSIAMVDATTQDGDVLDDHTIAAAGQGLVPALASGGPPELTIASPNQAMLVQTIPGPGVTQTIGQVVASNTDQPLQVQVVIWLVGNVTAGDVEADVNLAEALFLESRAGLEFVLDPSDVQEVTSPTEAAAIGTDCTHAANIPLAVFQADALNIYYVSGMPDKGMSCRDHPAIYVSADDAWDETLAHELGHKLGLIYPYPDVVGGHTTGIDGFEKNNLMWGVGTDKAPTRRHDLSLGQIFRINVDCRSWVNAVGPRNTGLTKCCQCDPYATGPCPLLAHDVVPVTSTGTIPSGWCSSVVCPFGC